MRILQKLQPLFVLLALLFMILLLRSQWAELQAYEWRVQPLWLGLSALFLLAAWGLEIQIWRRLLRVTGARLPFWPAVRIWFLSAIVRYVPGNIWQPLSMTLLCQRRGIAPEATLTSVVFYQVVVLLAATPIAGFYFGVTGNWGLLSAALAQWTPWLVALGLAPVVLYIVRPAWLVEVVNWALSRLHRPPLAADLPRPEALLILLAAVGDWLLWGMSFALLTFALQEYSAAEMLRLMPHLVAAYAIAYAVGFVSLITPSGLGVREGAIYVLLAPLLGGGVVTVAALAMRVWTTVGELIAAGLCLAVGERTPPAAEDAEAPPPGGPTSRKWEEPQGAAQ
jgi:uncharacterized membrane protein YbhN (UPF0104 family)